LIKRRTLLDFVASLATARVRRRFEPQLPHAHGRAVTITTGDGLKLAAWMVEPEAPVGTVVLGHGYRDDRRQLLEPLVEPLAGLGLRILAIDFRGHGESDGERITIGAEEAKDVPAVLDFAATLSGPVSYVGFSMGAAAYLLSGREAHAAVLDSPYDTLREAIGARLDRFFVPRRVMEGVERLRDEDGYPVIDSVRPIDAVAGLSRPTLILFAPRDPWLPGATRARFRATMSASCRFAVLARGMHQGHFDAEWRARVTTFLSEQYGGLSPSR
jgi:pimeloyl-ACP methyl ester carboxylesterase